MKREDAIKLLIPMRVVDGERSVAIDMAIEALKERPHGEWIYHKEWECDGECAFECSKCGMGTDVDYNFCPNCGADMRKSGEEK